MPVRTMRRLAALAALGALCALAALPASGQAAPGGDAFVEATSFMVAQSEKGSARATCPDGSRVVGGGINTTGPATGGGLVQYVIVSSGPQDATGTTAATEDGDVARSWFASISNNSGAAREFRVFALCSRDSDAVVEATAVTLGAYQSGSFLAATCPAGTRVTGGGVSPTEPTPDGPVPLTFRVQLSGPQDETGLTINTEGGDVARNWFAWVRNQSEVPREFRVFALCSAASDAIVETAFFSLANNGSGAATATCPAGRRALGGGLGTTGPVTPGDVPNEYDLQLSGPQDETGLTANTQDGDVARNFYAYVKNVSGALRDFKVVALCATDPGPAGAPGGGTPGAPGGPRVAGPGGGGLIASAPICLGKRATILGTAARDVLRGTPGPDVIVALGGNDVVTALAGPDLICAGAGNDAATGGAGPDRMSGGLGNDRMAGGAGADALLGGLGRDALLGGAGPDALTGGGGRDALTGGPGRDQHRQ